jgi:hypothetical protein
VRGYFCYKLDHYLCNQSMKLELELLLPWHVWRYSKYQTFGESLGDGCREGAGFNQEAGKSSQAQTQSRSVKERYGVERTVLRG